MWWTVTEGFRADFCLVSAMFQSVEPIDRLSSALLGFLKAPVSSFPSPVLHFQAPTPWRPITSSWGASTWSSFPKRSPRAPPTSSNDCAGSPPSPNVPIVPADGSVFSKHHDYAACVSLLRDNPSERLGNQKNGVKDIQKHKYIYQYAHRELLLWMRSAAVQSWQHVLVLQVVWGLQLGWSLPGNHRLTVYTHSTHPSAGL